MDVQLEAPGLIAYVPAAQDVQAEAPALLLYVFAAQGKQVELEEAPTEAEKVEGGHGVGSKELAAQKAPEGQITG